MHEQSFVSDNKSTDRHWLLLFYDWTSNCFSGKGEKCSEHSTTIALQSPFAEYNGCFELGLGQSVVSFPLYLFMLTHWIKIIDLTDEHAHFRISLVLSWEMASMFQVPSNYPYADQHYGLLSPYGVRPTVCFCWSLRSHLEIFSDSEENTANCSNTITKLTHI